MHALIQPLQPVSQTTQFREKCTPAVRKPRS